MTGAVSSEQVAGGVQQAEDTLSPQQQQQFQQQLQQQEQQQGRHLLQGPKTQAQINKIQALNAGALPSRSQSAALGLHS